MTGLLSTGFVPKRLDEIKTELEADFREALGQNVQLVPQSVFGQLVGIAAEREADVWEQAEEVYHAGTLGGAEEVALEDIGELAGVDRPAATFSEVTLTLGGDPTTVIPAGTISADPELDVEWTHLTEVVLDGGGAGTVQARPSATGPVVGLAGTITEPRTPISGWDTVTNAADAEVGRDVFSNAAYRGLIRLAMRAGGAGLDKITAKLLQNVDGVTEVAVIHNPTERTDSDGRPPHSVEVVVRGGADQDIVDQIFACVGGGIATTGNQSGTAVDIQGDNQDVDWSRPVEVDVYLEVDYTPTDGFPDDGAALIEAAILEYGSTFVLGQDVVAFQIAQRIETPGIESLTIRVGPNASPTNTVRLVVARTGLAVFDSARIMITEV